MVQRSNALAGCWLLAGARSRACRGRLLGGGVLVLWCSLAAPLDRCRRASQVCVQALCGWPCNQRLAGWEGRVGEAGQATLPGAGTQASSDYVACVAPDPWGEGAPQQGAAPPSWRRGKSGWHTSGPCGRGEGGTGARRRATSRWNTCRMMTRPTTKTCESPCAPCLACRLPRWPPLPPSRVGSLCLPAGRLPV